MFHHTAARMFTILALTLATLRSQDTRRVVPDAGQQQRLALVIGNNAYPRMPLANAVNDARGVAAALRDAEFQVQTVENADARSMEAAVQKFIGAIQPGDVGLFYYSGHGMQIGGANYLAPTDFQATTETDAKFRAFAVDRVMDMMTERGARLKIMILDACRDNPFGSTRSGAKGLASMSTGRGSFIAFATDPGKTADDNPGGGNGLFTKHLIDALREPGLKLAEVFDRAREGVERESTGRQVPWSVSSVLGEFTFRTMPSPVAPPPDQTNVEVVFWNSIKDSNEPSLFQAYLRKFPNGVFREIADIKARQPVAGRDAGIPSGGIASGVQTFPVQHWHGYSRTYFRFTDPVEGRMWIGNGKVEFQERGKGQKPEDNFSLTCAEVLDVKNYSETRFELLIGKKRYSFTTIPEDKRDEAAGLIRTMCEAVWFQRGSTKK